MKLQNLLRLPWRLSRSRTAAVRNKTVIVFNTAIAAFPARLAVGSLGGVGQ